MPKQSMHQASHQEAAGVTVGELIRPARPAMMATGLLTTLGALLSIVPFEAMRNLAAIWLGETSPQGWRGSPWAWAAIAVGALFASQALYLAGLGITHLAEARLRHHLRERVVEAISGLPLGRVAQIPHGTIRKMVCDDTTSIHTLVAHVPGDATNAVVMAAAGTAYLLWTDWRLACALVGLWVLALGAMLLTMSGLSGITERFGAAQTALAAATVEMLEGIKEIKGFQATDASRTRFSQARTEFSSLSYEWVSRSGKAISAMTAVLRPSTVFATVALLVVLFTSQGWTPLSATLPFFLVALGLPEGLMTLIGLMQHMYESRMAAQATADLLSLPPMPEGTHDEGEGPAPGRVDVEDVTFSYEAGSPVLHGASFTAEPGTVTALVGPSGGGKSTLARLIARFYDVDDGAVRISGVDVREATFPWLLSRVAVVLQDVALAHESVHDNIALGRPDATREQVEAAARAASSTSASHVCPMATTRSWVRKAGSSPEGSASASPWRAPTSRTPPSSSWTRPPPRPTRPPSATSTRPCPGSPPGGPSSSSPTACPRSATQTRSSSSTPDASPSVARTKSCWPPADAMPPCGAVRT